MNKIFLFLLCWLFAFSVFGMGVAATQTLNVTNLPETVSDMQLIEWTYSDSTNNRDQNCNLFYSTFPSQTEKVIISNNCDEVCLFPFKTDLPVPVFNSTGLPASFGGGQYIKSLTIFKLNTNFNILFSSLLTPNHALFGYTWNGSSWDQNIELTNFPDWNNQVAGTGQGGKFDVLTYNGTTKLLLFSEIGNITNHYYDWNGFGWELNSDGNGLILPTDVTNRKSNLDFVLDGTDLLLFDTNRASRNQFQTLLYDPINNFWNQTNAYSNDFNSVFANTAAGDRPSFTIYKNNNYSENSDLFMFGGESSGIDPTVVNGGYSGSQFILGNWHNYKSLAEQLKSLIPGFNYVDSYSDDQNIIFFFINAGASTTYHFFELKYNETSYTELSPCQYN